MVTVDPAVLDPLGLDLLDVADLLRRKAGAAVDGAPDAGASTAPTLAVLGLVEQRARELAADAEAHGDWLAWFVHEVMYEVDDNAAVLFDLGGSHQLDAWEGS